ncbi:MAG: hypothetical protein IT210_13375 [Armatimonadetes bacterium]|nr:hypothetical protein [Armatimonadota bacterium]
MRWRWGLAALFGLLAMETVFAFETLGPGKWFLKLTNPEGSGKAISVRIHFNPNRDPWYGETLYAGGGEPQKQPLPQTGWLAEGASTGWIDIGRFMSASPTFAGSPNYLNPVFLGVYQSPEGKTLDLQAELAWGGEKRGAQRFRFRNYRAASLGYQTWLGSGPKLPTVGLLIPVDPARGERIYTFEQAADQQLRWIRSLPPLEKRPEKIFFWSHQGGVQFEEPTSLSRMQFRILKELGYNCLTEYAADARDIEALKKAGYTPNRTKMVHLGDPEATAAEMKKRGLLRWVRFANLGDEISLSLKTRPEEQDRRFRQYLRRNGFEPMVMVRPEEEAEARGLPEADRWNLVRLGGTLQPEKPELFYEAANFRYRLWGEELKASVRRAEALFPKPLHSGANFSPHLNNWPDVRQWIDLAKTNALTMPWSEDWWWQIPEPSPQSSGFVLDALRLAARYHNRPIMYYTIPDPGETPEHFTRMNYLALSRGAKVLDHFAIYHQGWGTCDYIDFYLSRGMFPAIRRIIGDVARVEDRLAPARPRRAQVAVVLSRASDVWNTEDLLTNPNEGIRNNLYHARNNADNHERKGLWLALRHAQIPVDLITDDDIIEGRAASYKVLYLAGSELQRKAAMALRRWVRQGGFLVGIAGAGLWDEYRRPMETLKLVYGITTHTLDRQLRRIGPKSDLPGMKPLDTLRRFAVPSQKPVDMDALCYRETMKPARGARALARYKDGSVGAVENRFGEGKAWLIGTLPSMAYQKPAMSSAALPTAFPKAIRNLIASPARQMKVAQPAAASEPLVEAVWMDSPGGAIIPLINFHPRPVRKLTLRLSDSPRIRTVRSIHQGALPVTRRGGAAYVTLPLNLTDFLVVN